jgi:hypothetical protein
MRFNSVRWERISQRSANWRLLARLRAGPRGLSRDGHFRVVTRPKRSVPIAPFSPERHAC